MPLRRALLLLACLAPLLPAAPAPLPRHQKEKDPGGWSAPVDGLRVRLLSRDKRCRKGEVVRLTMEVHNVTGSALVIPDLDLPSWVSEPGAGDDGWKITGEQVNKEQGYALGLKLLDRLKRQSDIRKLEAGRSLRVEIEMTCGGSEKMAEEKTKELAEGEVRQQKMHFSDADQPGTYEFRASFRRDRNASFQGWDADKLVSPPVRIELTK